NEAADGSIEYGATSAYGMTASLGANPGTMHAHLLVGLTPGTTYHYRVQSADAAGNATYSKDQTFTTPSLLPGVGGNDIAPPQQGNIRVTSTGTNRVKITWTTSEPAQQRVEYGMTDAYQYVTSINMNYATQHAVELSGLSAGNTYHYRVRARDAAGNIATSPDFTVTFTPPASGDGSGGSANLGTAVPVVWTEAVNTAGESTGTIRKIGGCDGCSDGGAISTQKIEGRGYLEFRATVENTLRFVGLGARNTGTTASDIDFGLRLQGNLIEVRENGVYKADANFVAGDTFRIAVDGGKVTYLKNGTVFYTSTAAPAAALYADVALSAKSSAIADVQITSSTGALAWSNLTNVAVTDGTLRKISGCDGCGDALAIASAGIENGNGYLQITANVEDKLRMIGLSHDDATLSYSLRLQGNVAEVREDGKYLADTIFKEGDSLRITVENGVVSYVKNGVAFYTSPVRATTTLRAAALLFSVGGTVKDTVVRAQ
ncbi:MAG: hypothetical protein SV422_13485, partial [Pseudomonadota bacterium]|nr:hypothetical protein [Pseudomonadota bacterium]